MLTVGRADMLDIAFNISNIIKERKAINEIRLIVKQAKFIFGLHADPFKRINNSYKINAYYFISRTFDVNSVLNYVKHIHIRKQGFHIIYIFSEHFLYKSDTFI